MNTYEPSDQPNPPREKAYWIPLKMVLCIGVILFSILVLRPWLTTPQTYKPYLDYLNEKNENAMQLSLGSTSAAFVITMFPDDAGTPIANELAQFTGYLMIVISAILLEKFLLTSFGFLSSAILIPLSMLIFMLALFSKSYNRLKISDIALRLLIFSICIVAIIPVGCICGREIEKANAYTIEAALQEAQQANEIVQSIPEDQQNKNIFEKVGEFFSGLWKSATDAYEWAKTVLTNFLSSIAVMLITTIAIPLLIVIGFLLILKFLTKKDFTRATIDCFSNIGRRFHRNPQE